MLTLSREKGLGGEVKKAPEDFRVMEITGGGCIVGQDRVFSAGELREKEAADGKFCTFVLQKRNWNTISAVTAIAKLLRRGKKSIGYAGMKDKTAVTSQLASVYGVSPEEVLALKIRDIWINGAWRSDGVRMGGNLGNAFRIMIRGVEDQSRAEGILEELGGVFPNYFDRQRFGYRLNNPRVGMKILRNDMEGAVNSILTDTDNEENEEAREARKRLEDEMDFSKALEYFPKYLRMERAVISYMSRYGNYTNAIRMVPRGLSIMFIHAVQSLVFNVAVERMVRNGSFETGRYCARDWYGFADTGKSAEPSDIGALPVGTIIGYDTVKEMLSETENGVLEELSLLPKDFKIAHMPELSMRGSLRAVLAPIKDPGLHKEGDTLSMEFSIQSGSYATILINEMTKSDKLDCEKIAIELSM